jgi:3-oxoacyl-[acyl-carrier-protein] synthase-1
MEHPNMVDKSGDPFAVAMDTSIPDTDRLDRMFALLVSATQEVLEKLERVGREPISAFIGLPETDERFNDRVLRAFCDRCSGAIGSMRDLTIEGIAEGSAAGAIALQRAVAFAIERPDTFCLAGGVDSFVDADVLEGFDDSRRIASASNRWGFPPGEGAGMLAVCSPAFARANRLSVLASIAAVVTTQEPNTLKTESVCIGVGLGQALREAATASDGPITMQFCDINGERYREHEFSFAALRVPPALFLNVIRYVAPADCWGHTGAATAPLLSILPIIYHDRGASPGPRPLVWCGSDKGHRAAVALRLEKGLD